MARRKGPRGLRPEEERLWEQVARKTQPLHPERRREHPAAEAPKAPVPDLRVQTDLKDFRIGRTAPQTTAGRDLVAPLSERLAQQQLNMDAKRFGRMKRGKLGVEARIDLHGLTLAEAHPRLNRFILEAHGSGKRLVLVITGKGRDRDDGGPIPSRRGALRHQVPQWLSTGVLRQVVLQISEAHRSHGGSGAFYVYLRKRG
ncbi:Smr/MutS family protein [Maribius pontilimi]|uniref:Smr/MutS family protein n=1 Tax=Palleronia pontilimi TaxID=1964209 RepID=A0A934MBI2_9RHOB|nr:Smr/MutS family protein [Palleronia pontilimi]MBJ3761535.1 Smr/MutS family protein [Palleronia pontilimi]